MSDAAVKLMDVDEFLVWGEAQQGRFELHEGAVVAMAPERSTHLLAKGEVFVALREAVAQAKLPCRAYPDGATVRISSRTAYEPDALLRCGPPLPGDKVEIPDPLIVVEVLSPSSLRIDVGAKLENYFRVPSIAHYLIVDADSRRLIHHKRGAGDWIETRILGEGALRLDPPGLELPVESLFGPA